MVDETLPKQIYNVLEKSCKTFYHVVFLEFYKSYEITPIGFEIKKTPCVGKPSNISLLVWETE